ncbi:MAG: polysaccharide deacetylase family protein [Chloroflexi bacterium]|nr:polysaccharide deacetylase family protein [Chloroflexota bacterium]MCI0580723.1 polysaccharide deacetylase family protein [Chloroflexota bacterium]MCI0646640.1 polysaccharide deacetylase family protein [Chloroflexota bacterium]MCI0729223.1 polysaccharide deacetylase family protein [Chloroflexota bacterium]
MKHLLVNALQSSAGQRCLTLLESAEQRRPDQLRVLTYHRILNPAGFEQQMHYLAARYNVISLPELFAAHQYGKALPPRALLITFDDAYRNFADTAWPILKRHNLPVTLFVPTAYPDNPQGIFWWDQLRHALVSTPRRDPLATPLGRLPLASDRERVRVYKQLREYVKTLPHGESLSCVYRVCRQLDAPSPKNEVLSWSELRVLTEEGVSLGAHTQNHPLLTRLPLAEAVAEAADSLRDLQHKIGGVLPVFAYPDGAYNRAVVAGLRRAGFKMAFTTVRGVNDLRRTDPLCLRRNNVGEQATQPVLRSRLLQASLIVGRPKILYRPGAL